MRVTKKTKIKKIINENSEAAEILIENGLGCVFCPLAQQESLEQGCLAHGIDEKKIEKIVKELNKK
ncbi:disulfide oxidoreductase [Candidatus Pacearchaeota archaeon]|nr:MAG: disulfide oxidoreductase [Candidatus Pacearchaeota archaeon]